MTTVKQLFIVILVCTSLVSLAQIRQQFSIPRPDHVDAASFKLKAKEGKCNILPGVGKLLVNVYSNKAEGEFRHSLSQRVVNTKSVIDLELLPSEGHNWVRSVSSEVFGNRREKESFWKVYLSESIPFELDFEFGLGDSEINLSGLSVKVLRIRTASANVNIQYDADNPNQIPMETFDINVELGSVHVTGMPHSKAKTTIVEVSFGNIYLDFSEKPTMSQEIIGSVGAGNLTIKLPHKDVPIKARISNSWLCKVKLCRDMIPEGEGQYVNEAYKNDSKNALIFDLDVSVGKLIFEE